MLCYGLNDVVCCRCGGDIMVIEVQEHSGLLRGRVIAVLTVPGQYG